MSPPASAPATRHQAAHARQVARGSACTPSETGSVRSSYLMLNPKFSFAYTYDISVSYRVNLLKDRGWWHVGTSDKSLGPDLIQETVRGLH